MQLAEGDSMAAKYAMSVGAATIAEAVTYPLDLTKTRLQLQGEVIAGESNVKYRGMFKTAFGVVKEEVSFIQSGLFFSDLIASSMQGFFMLWRGMLPAIYRHAIYTGMRMTVYEEVRSTLQKEDKVRK